MEKLCSCDHKGCGSNVSFIFKAFKALFWSVPLVHYPEANLKLGMEALAVLHVVTAGHRSLQIEPWTPPTDGKVPFSTRSSQCCSPCRVGEVRRGHLCVYLCSAVRGRSHGALLLHARTGAGSAPP